MERWGPEGRDRFAPDEAPFDLQGGGGVQNAPAPPPSFPEEPSTAPGRRPRTAPSNAEWDLQAYERRAGLYERRARRFALAVVILTVLTAAVGAFTAVLDQAILGVVSGLLGAGAAGVEGWRTHEKAERKASAYRTGFIEIDNELDKFANDAGQYGQIVEATKDADAAKSEKAAFLTERLAAINSATERAMK